MKKHNYELIKKINIGCLILLIIVFISRFVNSNNFAEIFGVSNMGLNISSIMYFLGYNVYWILPLIVIVRNFIIIKNIKHSKYPNSYQKHASKNTNSHDTKIDNIIIKENKTISDNKNNAFVKSKIAMFIVIIILTISLSGNVILLLKHFEIKGELNELTEENERSENNLRKANDDLTDILGTNSKSYIKDKLNYMDNMIAFKVDGYNNYYFTYECLQALDNPKGEIIIKSSAKDKGYKEYKCKANLTYKNGYLEIE